MARRFASALQHAALDEPAAQRLHLFAQEEEEQQRSREAAAGVSGPAARALHHRAREKIAERQRALR